MTKEKNLLDFINAIKDIATCSNINNYRDIELIEGLKNNKKYLFKPLEDIKNKKDNIKEKRNGFLVYSKETITENKELNDLYKKDYENINEIIEKNTFRYYYYEVLDETKNTHVTIVMINPAFADSNLPDPTIRKVKLFFKNIYTECKSFDIVNLFPVRMPKLVKLQPYLDLTLNETTDNQTFVESFLSSQYKGKIDPDRIIIAAWGDKYNTKAREIFKSSSLKFKSYKKGSPAHFSPPRYNNVKDKGLYDFTLTEMDA